ncbi:hypothetical protein FRC10_000727 [Ceratobasidium sp. 414]|nr:hypothetical protein FRC10_000727 [Ceratobasidium sp. 414]
MSVHPKGATLIETVTRPIVDGKPGDSPLDKITVEDGFYRIVQYDEDGSEIDASFDATNPDLGIYGYSMVMSGTPQPAARNWKLTRQWGVTNGFTIVPKDTPGDLDTKFGCSVDTPDVCRHIRRLNPNSMRVVRWSYYNIWPIRCDESRTYRLKDGSTKTVYYFRILVTKINGYNWRTSKDTQPWSLGMHKATWDPISPLELYQFIPSAL